MIDYKPASNAKGNVGVTLGAIGTGLGFLNGGLGGLFGGYGRGRECYDGYDDCGGGKYRHKVTEHELDLVQQNNHLLSENSTLRSEKYTDCVTSRLAERICELEKYAAVNNVKLHDFERYADAEYIHQPKARINERLLTTQSCGCGCEDNRRPCYPPYPWYPPHTAPVTAEPTNP